MVFSRIVLSVTTVLVLNFSAAATDAAISNRCESLFVSPAQDVVRALQKLFRTADATHLAPELTRLDALLIQEVSRAIFDMNPRQRANFISILENGELGTPDARIPVGRMLIPEGTSAYLDHAPKYGLLLVVDAFTIGHPLSRILIRHELSHLSRLVSDAMSPAELFTDAENIFERRLGVYREEIAAYRDEYRYLRSAYTKENLPALRRSLPMPSPYDFDNLVHVGAIRIVDGNSLLDYARGLGQGPQIENIFMRYLISEYNESYLTLVERSLSVSEQEYIDGNIRTDTGYKKTQEFFSARKEKKP